MAIFNSYVKLPEGIHPYPSLSIFIHLYLFSSIFILCPYENVNIHKSLKNI